MTSLHQRCCSTSHVFIRELLSNLFPKLFIFKAISCGRCCSTSSLFMFNAMSCKRCCSTTDVVPKMNTSNDNKPAITVQTASNTKLKRVWDRRNNCLYCGKEKLSDNYKRHLMTRHKEEQNVKLLNETQRASTARLQIHQARKNKGN